jgi:CheY-like chemotaxis protein
MNELKANSQKTAQGEGPLIYVVDDEPMLLELATVILEPLGYRLETYRDAEEALRAFQAARPQPALIITDYAMHKMTGMDLMQACRRIHPRQKVLLVSGTVGPEIFENAPDKPNQFLSKPYQARELIEAVRSALAA